MIEPYWQSDDGRYTVYCADCLDVLPQLEAGSIDCIVTDPPYGVDKAAWDGAFPTEWIAEAERIAPRLLTMPGNSSLIEAGTALADYRDCIVLQARNGMTRSKIAFGNWFPVLASGDWKWKARPNHLPFNVGITEKIDHPSPKPLNAMLALITYYTETDWVILDPFTGSGTTGVACVKTGRRFIGIEISQDYCDIAVRRIKDALAQLPLMEAAG